MEIKKLEAAIEAILFTMGNSVELAQIFVLYTKSIPHSFAFSRRTSLISVTITLSAPMAFAACATRFPIGPAPSTAIFSPFTSPARHTAWQATAVGSIIAPSS